ncbi:hypothetical protein ACQ4WQ_21400 [Janthinobacterium sp. GB1R12]|uniref:hypothetical protein n=1 Tax=Janthinobacterium sp. GB1R12 TaxID=3424190 RepID=UPI003F25822E
MRIKYILRKIVAAVRASISTANGQKWARRGIVLFLVPSILLLLPLLAPIAVDYTIVIFQLKIYFIVLAVITTYSKVPRFRNAAQMLIHKLRIIDQDLNKPQRLYRNIVVLGVTVTLLGYLGAGHWLPYLWWTFVVYCIYVAVLDGLRWYQALSAHTLGKASITVIFAATSTLAYAMARQEIAIAIHVVPTNFTHTSLLMAIFTIPFLIVFSGGLIYATSMVASAIIIPVLFMARSAPKGMKAWLLAETIQDSSMKYVMTTKIFQVFFYGILGLILWQQGRPAMLHYETEIQKWLPAAVYNFDMYPGKECALKPGEKLAPLGDAKFLVAKRLENGDIKFSPPMKCDDLPVH